MHEATHAQLPRRIKENLRAQYVCSQELVCRCDASVYMRLRSEINHAVDSIPHGFQNISFIADIAANEFVAVCLDVFQVIQISCVCERIVIDDRAVGKLVEHKANESGSDKPCAARHKQFSHQFLWNPLDWKSLERLDLVLEHTVIKHTKRPANQH